MSFFGGSRSRQRRGEARAATPTQHTGVVGVNVEEERRQEAARREQEEERLQRERERAAEEAARAEAERHRREEEEERERREREEERRARERLEHERREEERRRREEERAVELAAANSHAARIGKEAWDDAFLPELTTPREGFAAVATSDGRILVLGGYHRVNYLSCGEGIRLVDTAEAGVQVASSWEALPNHMQTSRNWFGAAVLPSSSSSKRDGGDQVVVAGGYNPRYLKSSEVMDTTTQVWTPLPTLNSQRKGCAVVSLPREGHNHHAGTTVAKLLPGSDCVYVVGGCSDDEGRFSNTVEYYRPGSASWKYLSSPMNQRRLFCCAVLWAHRREGEESLQLIVMGGQLNDDNVTNAVECYDVKTRQWRNLAPMKHPRSEFAAVAMGSCIYVMGGYSSTDDHRTPLSSVEFYDARTKEWAILPQTLKTARAECAAVVVHGMIVLLGGRGAQQRLSSVEVLHIGDMSVDITLPELPCIASDKVGRQGRAEALEEFCSQVRRGLEKVESNVAETQRSIDEAERVLVTQAQDLYAAESQAATAIYERGVARLQAELDRTTSRLERERQGKLHGARQDAQRQTRVLGERTDTWIRKARQQLEQAQDELQALQQSVPPAPSTALRLGETAAAPPKPADQLVCPLTHEVMVDPVMTIDGQTYERAAIERWFGNFARGEDPTSPKTNMKLKSRLLFPNVSIKSLCDEYRSAHGLDGNAAN